MDFHPHEIKVLKALTKPLSPQDVASACGISVDAVLRASAWLKVKGLIEVEEKVSEEIGLGEEGKFYLKNGLPERQIIEFVGAGKKLDEVKKKFDGNIFGIGVGWLRRKNKASVKDGVIIIVDKSETADEKLLKKLGEGPIPSAKIDEKLRDGLRMLRERQNVVVLREIKQITLKPTKESKALSGKLEVDESASQLTPEMIVSGSWRKQSFRPYDVSVHVKPEYPAKKHPIAREIDNIRDIFVRMGFSEISGPMVESAFWNFDALFQPQDHPARELHDTFYLSHPKKIDIPGFEKYKSAVKKTHEDGGGTGSTGWQYKWNEETAKKVLLRTHTTAVTCRYLSTIKKEDLPAKVFSVGRVFRNEALDYKHLPEFYQVEGIVVDPNVTFRNLLGILERFYTEMNLKVRFRPGYFPYTEMSVEPEVYFAERGEWIEMGGAGIFRSEVVKPLLGFDCPVLAWGLGVDRIVAMKLGFSDIRTPYINDLGWLRRN
jgi:phenylalanyl-tRNA synthetase alpha chain